MSRLIEDLDPDVQDLCRALLHGAAQQRIVLEVTQTYRSEAEQLDYWLQGRGKPGPIVTWAPPGFSWHEFRRAFDVGIKWFPGDLTPRDFYDGPWGHVGAIGESLGLEWGGRWASPKRGRKADSPHFQHTGGRTLAEMRAARARNPRT